MIPGALRTWVRARRLARRGRARGLVLLYHSIAAPDSDPWSLAVSPERFREHLAILRGGCQPLALADLLAAAAENRVPKRAVAVTFDDGYANNLHAAAPALARYEIPATVFVVSGAIGGGEFWWDELDRLLLQPGVLPDRLELTVAGERLEWSLGADARYEPAAARRFATWTAGAPTQPTARHRLYRDLWTRLRPVPHADKQCVLADLRRWSGTPPAARETHRPLTLAELRTLAQERSIEIGAHTVTHPQLAALPADAQRAEIARSRAALASMLAHDVTSFSYPFGGPQDITPASVNLARESGFASACINQEGIVRSGVDPWRVPRAYVRNWDGSDFLRRLAAWFGGDS